MVLPASVGQAVTRLETCTTKAQQHLVLDQAALVQHLSWTLALVPERAPEPGLAPEQAPEPGLARPGLALVLA